MATGDPPNPVSQPLKPSDLPVELHARRASVAGGSQRVDDADWVRFIQDDAYRKHVELRIGVTLQFIERHGPPRLIGHVSSGVGLVGHLLASEGLPYVGIDRDAARVVLARVSTRGRTYPPAAGTPRFEKQPDAPRLPLDTAAVDLLLMFDCLPGDASAALAWDEAHRVVAPDGCVIVIERRDRLTFDQLLAMVRERERFAPIESECWNDPARDIVVIARRMSAPVRDRSGVTPGRPDGRAMLPTVRIAPQAQSSAGIES